MFTLGGSSIKDAQTPRLASGGGKKSHTDKGKQRVVEPARRNPFLGGAAVAATSNASSSRKSRSSSSQIKKDAAKHASSSSASLRTCSSSSSSSSASSSPSSSPSSSSVHLPLPPPPPYQRESSSREPACRCQGGETARCVPCVSYEIYQIGYRQGFQEAMTACDHHHQHHRSQHHRLFKVVSKEPSLDIVLESDSESEDDQ